MKYLQVEAQWETTHVNHLGRYEIDVRTGIQRVIFHSGVIEWLIPVPNKTRA